MFMIPESNHKWQDNVIINFKKSDIMRNDTNEKYLKGYKRIMSGKTEMQKEKKQKRSVTFGKISSTLMYMQWKS